MKSKQNNLMLQRLAAHFLQGKRGASVHATEASVKGAFRYILDYLPEESVSRHGRWFIDGVDGGTIVFVHDPYKLRGHQVDFAEVDCELNEELWGFVKSRVRNLESGT